MKVRLLFWAPSQIPWVPKFLCSLFPQGAWRKSGLGYQLNDLSLFSFASILDRFPEFPPHILVLLLNFQSWDQSQSSGLNMVHHFDPDTHLAVLSLVPRKEPGSLCSWDRTENRAKNANIYRSNESFMITCSEDKVLKI